MIEDGGQNLRAFHLAGIIPVAGQPLDFNMPWHDSLMPIGKDYLAVEKAAYECAMAGCETIWIVCHKEMQPLIRHRLGDWIIDPMTEPLVKQRFVKFSRNVIKQVPIYYVPIHPKDRDKRDCLSWSALYGVVRAFHVSKLISKWTVPDKYYIAFPYGVYPISAIKKNRELISAKKKVFFTHKNKSVANNEYLPFTMDPESFAQYRRDLRKNGTLLWKSKEVTGEKGNYTIKGEKYDIEDRYSARNFSLEEVFGNSDLENSEIVELDWYYNIGSWEGYRQFLGSPESKSIWKHKYCLKYHEWNKIGEDNDSEE